ncbi:HlyD family secretion protein [Ferruginibacter sp.]
MPVNRHHITSTHNSEQISITATKEELQDSLIQEIISNRPGFITRRGTSIFLVVLLLMIAACWLISYPDTVLTKAKLTSLNAPKEVKTLIAGKLVRLFVKENTFVKKGTVLAFMESIADPEEVIALDQEIDNLRYHLDNNAPEKALPYLTDIHQQLGELQPQYQTFMQQLRQFCDYLSSGFYLHKKNMLQKDMMNLQRQHSALEQQKEILEKDLDLTQQTFDANKQLKTDGVISAFDYRNEESKLLNKKISLPQISSNLLSNENTQNEKQKEILELDNQVAQQKNIFIQSLNTFKSELEEWKKKYILTAPVDGVVAFASFLQENQQLENNRVICFVNPGNASYYAEIHIPQTNFGKVHIGQEVQLKFAAYPFQEYGYVRGRIDFISNITTDSGYLARVILPNKLQTNYKKQVQFTDGLAAQAEIITQNMRLLQRFYNSMLNTIKN